MTETYYTSPRTGVTYTVIKSYSERGDWDSEGNYAPVTVKQFSVYKGTTMVQYAFDEVGIAKCVERYENPGPDLGSRFD
jgi:hypothetical protein